MAHRSSISAVLLISVLPLCPGVWASDQLGESPADVLTQDQWRALDTSLDRAVRWLAAHQQDDGSFAGPDTAQPAITSFAVLALLSDGHLPGQGPYGEQIDKAIDFVLSCQKGDGLFCELVPEPQQLSKAASHTAMYNHGIAGVMLCEVYGMAGRGAAGRLTQAIESGLAFTATMQDRALGVPGDTGAWRYLRSPPQQADLSVTSWHLMFYRSARNAGFDVTSERIDRAIRYVLACFEVSDHRFLYYTDHGRRSRAMTGAGILALTHGGQFDHEMARQAGNWLLAHPYRDYSTTFDSDTWFHYGLFYAVPAMYMLGGRHWEQFFPTTVNTMLRHQNRDGSWPPEPGDNAEYGNIYSTALVITALNTPNQLLPIMQR